MTAFNDKLNRAAEGATCRLLDNIGAGLVYAGAASIVAGGAGVVPITFGAAALMASEYGCDWDPNQGTPLPPYPGDFCYEGASTFQIRQLTNGEFVGGTTPEIKRIIKIEFEGNEICGTGGSRDTQRIYWETANGQTGDTGLFTGGPCGGARYSLEQVWTGDATCLVPGPKPTNPEVPPYEHTDPVDGCKIIVNFKGFQTDEKGHLNPVYKMEPGPELRNDGGRIGGCTFNNIVYTGAPIGGGGEPPVVGPWLPEWDDDPDPFPWKDWLMDVLAGAVGSQIANLINELFDLPYTGTTYRLVSVCELDEDGEPVSKEVVVEVPSANSFSSVIKRIDALVPLLQGQKDFKQPICAPVKPQGEFRTIGFISEDYSPNGRNYLRKRLRYRSMSGIGLGELIDYWQDFDFGAGQVTV